MDDELKLIGKLVSRECFGLFNELIITFFENSLDILLVSDTGMEYIMDKNYYIANNIPFSNVVSIRARATAYDKNAAPEITDHKRVNQVLGEVKSFLCYKPYAKKFVHVLLSVNKIIYDRELANPTLDYTQYKPTFMDYTRVEKIITADNFRIIRQTNTDSICLSLNFKGILIPVLYTTTTVQNIRNKDLLEHGEFRSLKPEFFIRELELRIKTAKGTEYKRLLETKLACLRHNIQITKENKQSSTLYIHNTVQFDLQDSNSLRNTQDTINMYKEVVKTALDDLELEYDNNNEDGPYFGAINCYTRNGDGPLNSALLIKRVLGSNTEYKELMNRTFNAKNHYCQNFTVSELEKNLNTIYGKISEIKAETKDMLNLVRFTSLSMMGDHMTNIYNVGNEFHTQTFLSTTYTYDTWAQNFLQPYTPFVLFFITVSGNNCGKFMMIDDYSSFDQECEVLVQAGTKFKITNKRYENVQMEDHIIQKLVLYLVCSDDQDAENYQNMYLRKSDIHYRVQPNNSIDTVMRSADNTISGGGLDISVDEELHDFYTRHARQYKKSDLILSEDRTSCNRPMNFVSLLPYFLSNVGGIKLNQAVYGYDYLNPQIFQVMKYLENNVVVEKCAIHTPMPTAASSLVVTYGGALASILLSRDFVFAVLIVVIILLLCYSTMKYLYGEYLYAGAVRLPLLNVANV